MTSPRLVFCAFMSVLLSCYGCAPTPSKPSGSDSSTSESDPRSTSEPRRVIIISSGKAPAIDFQQGPRAKLPSTHNTTAATRGAAAGAQAAMQNAGMTYGLSIVLLPAVVLAGALIGYTTTGWIDRAVLSEEMSKAAEAVKKDLDQRMAGEIARSLREAGIDEVVIERERPASHERAASGGWKTTYPSPVSQEQQPRRSAYATLHVTLLRVGFEATPRPEYLAVVVAVKVSTMSAGATGSSLTRSYTYRSVDRQAGDWTEVYSIAFKDTLRNAWSLLADQVAEDLLLDASAHIAPNQDGTCGLSSTDSIYNGRNDLNRIAVLQSRQPTLTWSPFNPVAIRDAGSAAQATGQNAPAVTYDLRIWRLDGGGIQSTPIYSRSGLVSPEHKVETQLAGKATYAWSVRARVVANSRSQVVTPWTTIVGPGDEEEKSRLRGLVSTKVVQSGCLRSLIIDERYLRFVTPG